MLKVNMLWVYQFLNMTSVVKVKFRNQIRFNAVNISHGVALYPCSYVLSEFGNYILSKRHNREFARLSGCIGEIGLDSPVLLRSVLRTLQRSTGGLTGDWISISSNSICTHNIRLLGLWKLFALNFFHQYGHPKSKSRNYRCYSWILGCILDYRSLTMLYSNQNLKELLPWWLAHHSLYGKSNLRILPR